MNFILVICLSLILFIQNNQALKTSFQHVKSLKFNDFKERVNSINANYKQGIWFRIGKKSIQNKPKSPNKHTESLDYKKAHKSNMKNVWCKIG